VCGTSTCGFAVVVSTVYGCTLYARLWHNDRGSGPARPFGEVQSTGSTVDPGKHPKQKTKACFILPVGSRGGGQGQTERSNGRELGTVPRSLSSWSWLRPRLMAVAFARVTGAGFTPTPCVVVWRALFITVCIHIPLTLSMSRQPPHNVDWRRRSRGTTRRWALRWALPPDGAHK
jgi:hypothetical protein